MVITKNFAHKRVGNSEKSYKLIDIKKVPMITEKTAKIRHGIVRLIAPKIYKEAAPRKTRPFTKFIQKKFNDKSLLGVEIGVLKGFNALNLLDNLNIEKIYLIDPYGAYEDTDNKLFSKIELRSYFNQAQKAMTKYKDVVQFIVSQSSEAVTHVPDNLDFVYIDGCHKYEVVKDDIEKYWQKVKNGGVIGGHDFTSHNLGVIKAVMEFVNNKGLDLQASYSDWWIVKPDLNTSVN